MFTELIGNLKERTVECLRIICAVSGYMHSNMYDTYAQSVRVDSQILFTILLQQS